MAEFVKPIFSSTHISKDCPSLSISQILAMLVEPFDGDKIAQRTYDRHFEDETSKYYHKTKEEIIQMWSDKGAESMHYGSLLDDYIGVKLVKTKEDVELYKLDNNYDYDSRLKGLCDSFDHFYSVLSKSGDTIFIDREQEVWYPIKVKDIYHKDKEINYNIRGRFDALFYNQQTKKWIVIDWKSSGTINTIGNRWTQNLLGPMNMYPALNYYTYTTQLYFYKIALVDGGYLPKGTTYDDVIVMIVNLPGHEMQEYNGRDWASFRPAYTFDPELMHRLFVFAVNKDNIMREVASKQNNLVSDTPEIVKQDINLDDDFSNIF